MTIRPAQPADLDTLVAIARACFGAEAWSPAQFEPSPLRLTLLAEPGVGFLVMQLVANEAELQSLAVLEPYRRRGVGSALLAAALEEAGERQARKVYLEVRAGNRVAQSFYRRHGFQECGRRPRYYRHPDEAAVLMRLAANG